MTERIVERSSAEMYMEDQCKYAIFVDRRRALPELRDGLKTVQRRILYVAYQQGMTSPNKREKSSGRSLSAFLKRNRNGLALWSI